MTQTKQAVTRDQARMEDDMITRKDYMEKRATHAEFYRDVNAAAGVKFRGNGLITLNKVRKALSEGDEHLNTIPLRHWDGYFGRPISLKLDQAFRDRGDWPSPAGLVCCAKQAARDAVKGS